MAGMGDKSAFESFDRMAEKIEDIERKALAAAELQQEFSGEDLINQFKALEYKGSTEQQLLELKVKMGVLSPGSREDAKQLGTGDEDVEDAELVDDSEAPGA
jgi:phage shock protein A